MTCLCEDLLPSRVNPVFDVKEGGLRFPFTRVSLKQKFGKVVELSRPLFTYMDLSRDL